MLFPPDNINLASYILHEIVRKMQVSANLHQNGIEWEKDILYFEKKTTDETVRHMKSLVGAFDHAAVVGACLTSGWFEHHANMLVDEKNPEYVQKEIAQFSHLITHIIHKKTDPIRPDDKRTKMQLTKMGFQLGLDLGRCLNNMTPYSEMSSFKMREMLEMIKVEPALLKHGKKPLAHAYVHTR